MEFEKADLVVLIPQIGSPLAGRLFAMNYWMVKNGWIAQTRITKSSRPLTLNSVLEYRHSYRLGRCNHLQVPNDALKERHGISKQEK
jgi:hypothetical protein